MPKGRQEKHLSTHCKKASSTVRKWGSGQGGMNSLVIFERSNVYVLLYGKFESYIFIELFY